MAYQPPADCLTIGVSTRALFDLEKENDIYEKEGLKSYSLYQLQHENDILKPGTGFMLISALLGLNKLEPQKHRVEVLIMSRNSADTSRRIFNSIEHYGLDIGRAVLSGGEKLLPYLNAFNTDLFLSAYARDVQEAINDGKAAGIICTENMSEYSSDAPIKQIRIAFDGDAVLFGDESERIYKAEGLEKFTENERENADQPLSEGPFAKFLKTISALQKEFSGEEAPIRTALVTARNTLASKRVQRTLQAWDVHIDEAFFLGGMSKAQVLSAFGAHIFFDDQAIHTDPASKLVPSARVPYKGE